MRARSRLVAAASCAAACAQPASAHRRERDAPAITLSVVRAVPRYGRVVFIVIVLRGVDPLSRLSFFRTTHGHGGTLCTRVRECRPTRTG